MKLSTAIRKRLGTVLILCALIGGTVVLPRCGPLLTYAAYYGDDALIQLILNIFGVPISPDARLHAQGIHHLQNGAQPQGIPGNVTMQEIAPFFGNLSAVTVTPTTPVGEFFGLQRQTNCSLTRVEFTAAVNNAQTAVTVTPGTQTAHYENTIHSNSFSTTTPGVYPHGCADSSLGISARPLVLAGIDASGALRVATIGNAGVLTTSVKADGTFLAPVTQATDLNPIGLLAGDFNKDGIPDLVSMNSSGLASSITIFLGKADGTYQPGVNISVPGNATRFGVIDDLDGDGNLDLMVSSGIPGFSFSIFLGNGNGTFKPVQTFTPSVANLDANLAFITADVNGDHRPDIITAQGAVFLNSGDGVNYTSVAQPGFTPVTNGTSTFGPQILAADFNNDGKTDLATNDGSTIRTFIGQGNGTFTIGHAYATIADSGFMAATDLDGDGNVDIWSGYSGAGIFGPSAIEAAYPLLGNGDGTFQGAQSLPAAYIGTNLADLNGDGHPDLVGASSIPNMSGPSALVFTTSLGHANGVFTNGPQLVAPDYISNVNTHYPISGADSFVVADFDGDHIPDLIYIPSQGEIPVAGYFFASGKGDGGFNTPMFVPAPTMEGPGDIDINQQISGIAVADFNHDGKLDLIYSFTDISFLTGVITEGITVQLGNGNGTFQPAVISLVYSSTTPPTFAFNNFIGGVADVNGDNFPDVFLIPPTVIVDGTAQHQVELFIANGDGSFKAPSNLTLTGNMMAPTGFSRSGPPIAVADLNGDGKADLVASGSSADGTVPEVAIALGNGNGTFQPSTILQFPGFGPMVEPVLGDFDGDGKLDLFVSGAGSIAGIFPGVGDGSFQTFSFTNGQVLAPQAFLLNVWGPAAATDFDGDGKLDLIVGSVVLLSKNGVTPPPVPAATTTAVTAAPNPAGVGATVTLTATVTSTTSGTITGTVTFFDGANSIGPATVGAGGVATFLATTLTSGTHSITATYGGDANFATSTSTPAVTVTISGAATTTLLDVSSTTGTYGVTEFAFDVNVGPGGGTPPTGSVSLFDGTHLIQTATLQNGSATIFVLPFEVEGGTHSYTATYNGDAQNAPSTSTPVIVTVNPVPTTTSLTSSTAGATFGMPVTFTATVASTMPGPLAGIVTFFDGITPIGLRPPGAGGVATLTTSTLSPGSHSITAQYGSDVNFTTSTSNPVTVIVNLAPTSTALTAAPNPADSGTNVTFTAHVTSTATGTITGTVTFSEGGTSIGMGTIGANGMASLQTAALSVGNHVITAVYSGDANFVTSTSAGFTVLINPAPPVMAPTSTALAASPNPAGLGVNVTLTATVTSATAGAITGTVTFLDGGNSIGTGSVGAGGVATLQTSSLSMATHSITAMYGGDANYATSTSQPAVSLVITAAPTFTLSVAPQSVSVRRHEPGTTVVTVTPMNGFNEQVQLSCSAAEDIECEFEPGSVTPDGAPVTSNLTVSFEQGNDARPAKSAGIAIGPASGGNGGAGKFAKASKTLFVPLFVCELLLLAGIWRRRKFAANSVTGGGARFGSRLQTAYAVALLLTIATLVAGCAGTPGHRGPGTITITGTAANNQTVTVPLTVTVQ